jgi:4-amino-4-deoxy-L-arabinose transferase-like glycosyltransferase
MARDDLERPDLEELDWSAQHRSESLSQVFRHAIGLARSAEDWYARKRRVKAAWGRALRVGAIVLGAVAAVLPILAQISTADDRPAIPPGWSAVALAIAASLVALDRYFGFSAAWMRFMAAELAITRLRHDFEYAWQAARATAGDPPSDGEVAALLELARNVVVAVDDVIANETGAWITEFRTNLEQAEQALGRSARR